MNIIKNIGNIWKSDCGYDFTLEQVSAVASALCWGFNTPEAFVLIAGWPRRECGDDWKECGND